MISNHRETDAVCIEYAFGAILFAIAMFIAANINVKNADANTTSTSGIITTVTPEGAAPYDGPIIP